MTAFYNSEPQLIVYGGLVNSGSYKSFRPSLPYFWGKECASLGLSDLPEQWCLHRKT